MVERHLRVAFDRRKFSEAEMLSFPRATNPIAHSGRAFSLKRPSPWNQGFRNRSDRWYLDMKVHSIEERPSHPPLVGLHLAPGTAAGFGRMAEKPARAGIHRGDEAEATGKPDRATAADQTDRTFLQRLPEEVQYTRSKLRDLVQEENPTVRKAHLSRTRIEPSPDQPGWRHCVMRRTKWANLSADCSLGEGASHALDKGDLERLAVAEGRQNRRHRLSQERFPRAGRSDEKEVMSSGSGHFKSTFRALLSANDRQIHRRWRRTEDLGPHTPSWSVVVVHLVVEFFRRHTQKSTSLTETPNRFDLDLFDPRNLGLVLPRNEQGSDLVSSCGQSNGQSTSGAVEPAAQRQFSNRGNSTQTTWFDDLMGREDRQSDRKIETAPLFAKFRRRQIDRRLAGRNRWKSRPKGCQNSLFALANRGVGKTDQRCDRVSFPARYLHFDRHSFDSMQSVGLHLRMHSDPSKLAVKCRPKTGVDRRPLAKRRP